MCTSPHRQRYHLPPRSSIPHPLHSDTDSSTIDHRPATYAQVVTRNTIGDAKSDADVWTTVRRTQNTRRPPSLKRPVDPRQEGRCYRCLARGHVARSCREPVKCRICWQGGHCQASCPHQTNLPSAPASTGLYACLVGELREADLQWQQIIDGIQMLCPNLTSPDCHRLPAGDVFIRGLSKEAWRLIHDQTQQLNGGRHILW